MNPSGHPMITRFPTSPRLRPAGVLARLCGARDGATAVEFAFTFPMIAMLVVAIMEFGMIMFVGVLMESGLRDASRYGITGYVESGLTRMERIVQIVGEHTLGLVDMAKVDFDVLVYPGFGDVGGEEFVDGNGNGTYDAGETFTDKNANGVWDSDIGVPGPGDAGDVVVYRIRYDWPLMTPFAATFIGSDPTFPIRASVAVRNEPW
ncbi:MAG: pilus assembly protein [Rhodospirillales bacterium]|nr:pilus assembly protein [Rhodospirillales bacterium]